MHRHGYKGRKFNRETDQRRALMKGLADSLIEHGSIETTLPKAKELRPYVEKLVTKAKKGDVHNRRLVIAKLNSTLNAHKLFDEVAPQLSHRTSGYLRIERTGFRKGDNAEMAKISFVDDTTAPEDAQQEELSTAAKTAASPTKVTAKKSKKGDA